MHTVEQRTKAVELFIESGFSENAVYRELGYPSPDALRRWCKEYQETGTFHESVDRKPKYTQEQTEGHSGSGAKQIRNPAVMGSVADRETGKVQKIVRIPCCGHIMPPCKFLDYVPEKFVLSHIEMI